MTEIEELQEQITDLTNAFKKMAEALQLVGKCEAQTTKQIANLELEIAAIKFGRDDR